MYLLDTNVLSEMRKFDSPKVDPNVRAWCAEVEPAELFLSVIALKELEQGILSIDRRDAAQGRILRAWLERSVIAVYRDRILPVSTEIARVCAALNVPDPRPLGDALMAATARVHGMKVVTRNTKDFEGTGVEVVDPWQVQLPN